MFRGEREGSGRIRKGKNLGHGPRKREHKKDRKKKRKGNLQSSVDDIGPQGHIVRQTAD